MNYESAEKPNEEEDQENKKENTTEEKLGKIDEIFDELLDKVKDAPEAKQEALRILIEQMRQVGEQLKQVRDMKHLHEMKKIMMKHWEELNELAAGNPTLLKTIHNWGKKFVEEKIIYYDIINEVKDELIDKSQEIQEGWADIQSEIGKAVGIIDSFHLFMAKHVVDKYLRKMKINFEDESFKRGSGIEDFIASLNEAIKGFDEEDIDVKSANDFMENISGLTRELYAWAYKQTLLEKRPIEEYPELGSILNNIQEISKTISSNIKEASKIYKVTKKIRDTHFLPLYVEQPEQIAA